MKTMLSISIEFAATIPDTSLLIKNMLAIASLPSSFLIGVGSGWSLHCKLGELRHYPSQNALGLWEVSSLSEENRLCLH